MRALVTTIIRAAIGCSLAMGCGGFVETNIPPPLFTPEEAAHATPMPRIETPPVPPVAAREPKPWTLHGRTLEDDYAWLRKKDDPKVLDYLKAENAYADHILAPTDTLRDRLYEEMVARVAEDDVSAPVRDHGFFYYQRQEKGKELAIHCRKKGHLDAPEQVLVDLNAIFAKQKFASLGDRDVSPSGRYFAYGIDVTGFRQYELRIIDLDTNKELTDRAERVTSVAFAADNKTLLYTVEDAVAKRSYRLYRHTVGDPVAKDVLVYEEPDERFEMEVRRTRSGAYLVLTIESHTTTELRTVRADAPAEPLKPLLPRKADQEYSADHQGDRFLVRINDKGRNFRLVSVPVKNIDLAKAKEILPHRPDVMLESVAAFRDHLVVEERARGLPQLEVVDNKGTASHIVTMPEAAYELHLEGNREFETRTLRFDYESPTTPSQTIDYDVDTRERRMVKRTEVRGGFDRERYQVGRLDVPVRDGVKVPVTLLMPKGTAADGTHPLVLYGYGAYGYPTAATFSSSRLSLVDRGVIWAIAHVRGGGELGKTWHDAGRMAQKKHTFEDFIDVGEYLVKSGWAKPGALGAWGASAGGLLMGAVTNARPDLFRVVVAQVPFVDVLNTMLDDKLPLTVGEFEEWGNPKDREQFGWMAAYSPYDNITPRAYPAMLVRSSYNDSQVMYWEPAKYVARLRANKKDAEVLVLRMLLDPAGHGGRSGRYEKLKDLAADYAFVLWQLGVVPT
jgi:oligopeptidase B